ncbi:MAG: shikimate dehydrogenase [Candidatus Acidiferrales bacterium]
MPEVFGKDRICGVVAAPTAAEMVGKIRGALRRTHTIELRLDWLRDAAEIRKMLRWLAGMRARFLRAGRATLIATCRRRAAGGKFHGTMAAQVEIMREAALHGCAWIDVEIETAEKLRKREIAALRSEARLLISYHNFRRTPANLRGVQNRLKRMGGDAIKIATMTDSYGDATRVLEAARTSRRVVAIPMGDVGAAVRILALRGGSALAYAPAGAATAPGQISFDDLKNLYRADRLDRRTRVYGVIGNPVHHSLSPHLQNAGFQTRRMNAVYVPFLVRELRDFLASVELLGIAGFSVTIPHKEAILKYLDDCDPLAAAIGAVNTVVVRGGRKLFGYNTDYVGVLRALERRIALAGSCVLILGAGGAARAVAFALGRAGATVRICARRPARARALARAVGGEAIERKFLRSEFFDAIVNSTPVGMYPKVGVSPLEARELNCRLVFDLIYRPRRTKLVQLAERRGIETVSGLDMFVAQGTAQWEIWTGERAPVEAMRRAVVEALGREEARG